VVTGPSSSGSDTSGTGDEVFPRLTNNVYDGRYIDRNKDVDTESQPLVTPGFNGRTEVETPIDPP
jgi:hypothetical protein